MTEKDGYIEQVHRDCGGAIAIVAQNRIISFVCKKCKKFWTTNMGDVVCDEFEDYCGIVEVLK